MSQIYDELLAEVPNGVFAVHEVDADVDIAGPKYFTFTPSLTAELDAIIKLTALTAGVLEIYKTPTITVAGSAMTPVALDQNASFTPDTTFKSDPTITVDGTLILNTQVPASYQDVQLPKIKFQKGATYAIKFTSIADNNKTTLQIIGREVNE